MLAQNSCQTALRASSLLANARHAGPTALGSSARVAHLSTSLPCHAQAQAQATAPGPPSSFNVVHMKRLPIKTTKGEVQKLMLGKFGGKKTDIANIQLVRRFGRKGLPPKCWADVTYANPELARKVLESPAATKGKNPLPVSFRGVLYSLKASPSARAPREWLHITLPKPEVSVDQVAQAFGVKPQDVEMFRGQAHINVKTVERATSFVEDAKKKPISLGGEPISVDYSILWPQQPSTTLRYRGWTLPVGELEKALAPHKAVIQSISPLRETSTGFIKLKSVEAATTVFEKMHKQKTSGGVELLFEYATESVRL